MGALLPSLIDAAGIKVIPATLTVGDYIITPKMCIERKSLPDLEGSFANGRLWVGSVTKQYRKHKSSRYRHTQCESMTAHYEICILLIEFEEDRFSLRVSLLSSFQMILCSYSRLKKTQSENLMAVISQKKRLGTHSYSNPNLSSSHSTSPD
jgi:ERCC4-type nuclease